MNAMPLGLPEGTVRAIFALMFAATACYLAIARRVPADTFLPVVMAIVGYYFGLRQGPGAQNGAAPEAQSPPPSASAH